MMAKTYRGRGAALGYFKSKREARMMVRKLKKRKGYEFKKFKIDKHMTGDFLLKGWKGK